ncbi:hypothetical protein [Streptomyces sp. NPDC005776]|uniref:hypothetical protein n=1 Tax=unclassified Streptomyces TaxID=2593676 RepID=UPI0033F01486
MPRYPRGLNSGKTAAQTCIRSCSVGDKWTIPVGICTGSFQLCGKGRHGGRTTGRRRRVRCSVSLCPPLQ